MVESANHLQTQLPFAGENFRFAAPAAENANQLRLWKSHLVKAEFYGLDWVRSRHDDEVGTRERYSAAVLKDRLQLAGFAVERLTYANGLLLGAAVLWRLTERFTPAGPARDLSIPPAPINRLAVAVLDLERRWIAAGHRLPFGLSVIATARRPFPPIHA